MTILRAPTSWLTSLAALSPPAPSMSAFQFEPVGPSNQAGASNPPSGLSINSGSQIISGLGTGVDSWLIVQPWAARQLAGGNAPSMPSEQLQLSRECACDFRGAWPAVFQALGFTAFTPTNNQMPTLGC